MIYETCLKGKVQEFLPYLTVRCDWDAETKEPIRCFSAYLEHYQHPFSAYIIPLSRSVIEDELYERMDDDPFQTFYSIPFFVVERDGQTFLIVCGIFVDGSPFLSKESEIETFLMTLKSGSAL